MNALLLLSLVACALQSYAVPVARPAPSARDASDKLVVAHFMVGNTDPYTVDDWTKDITLASSKGIDGFALNVGSDAFQKTQVANAYSAAEKFGPNFKLFVSLDMSSLPCTAAGDTAAVQSFITTYSSHPNQLQQDGKAVVSTFAGESCTFGQGSLNDAWTTAVKASSLPPVYFIPSFFVDPATFSGLSVIDGAFNWNGGWPQDDTDISFDSDTDYLNNLKGKSYMAAVSPWFFTHYGVDSFNKNFIFNTDDWLLAERWELLVKNRDSIPFVEIITWNDYGESHYIGPIEGDQPNSQAWVDGFDHQGWLDLIAYYITAYKTGTYPAIKTDRTFLWSRLFPAAATAPDAVGPPTNAAFDSDTLWAVTLLTSPASVTLACGSSTNTTQVPAGLSKLSLPLSGDCSVTSTVSRTGSSPVTFAPEGFKFSTSPPSFNFNAFVAASPAT
ncbi:glycoside hydrolase family 71 protein [Plicaturopsis crispa FD-325 SS-3]|nr:glycoside hydrolase family 71 protein [Plicaturopsis crispa FD-325 SS-3]